MPFPFPISPLTLGTVQFGLAYGVANAGGRPAFREVIEILGTAIEGGITLLDTAAAYGESEEVIGRALRELAAHDRLRVITKVPPLSDAEFADPSAARRVIVDSVAGSRRKLGLDCLPLVMFHRERDAKYLDALLELGERGWLHGAGVSCNAAPAAAVEFAANSGISALQIPCNMLDPRYRQSGALECAAANAMAVFVRSIYLQGLLLMPEDRIPLLLEEVIPARRALERVLAAHGLTMASAALRYILSLEGVSSIVTGVDTPAQLRENLALAAQGPLPPETMAAIEAAVPALPELILTPPLWEAHKATPAFQPRGSTTR
jgi:aryl-alcohol dehydrogenase-like predicted oxidoreductase